jgi:hypothetical protein
MKHLKLFEETILKFYIGNIVMVNKNSDAFAGQDEHNHIFTIINVRSDNNTFMYLIKDISRCDVFYSNCWMFGDELVLATVEDIEMDEARGNAKKYNL